MEKQKSRSSSRWYTRGNHRPPPDRQCKFRLASVFLPGCKLSLMIVAAGGICRGLSGRFHGTHSRLWGCACGRLSWQFHFALGYTGLICPVTAAPPPARPADTPNGRNAKTAPHARHRHPATALGKFPPGACFLRVSESRLIEISNVRLIHSTALPPSPSSLFVTIASVACKCACNGKK